MNNAPIGVFDSGIGGLSCVEELVKLMPNEDIVYLGDTARIPYGTKSRDTIAEYASQDIAFLEKHKVKMILVACGTVSSVMMTKPVFEKSEVSEYCGVVVPAANAACAATKNNIIGVLGTDATIKSGSYGKVMHEMKSGIKVVGKACPMFVPLVENGYTQVDCAPARYFAEEYLAAMKRENVDTIILGCTHYPHLSQLISDIMGPDVTLISSGAELAKYAQKTLSCNGSVCDRAEAGTLKLYCTDSKELFSENVEKFLGKNINAEISKCSLVL